MNDEELIKLFTGYIEAHTEEMLSDIDALCRIPSVQGEALPGAPFGAFPKEALLKAREIMERFGLKTALYDDKVVSGDLSDLPRTLDILAHVDVVAGGEGWKETEPFEPVVKDGRIYGRGTSDDKGPAVAALYAMRAVKELGIPLRGGCRLVLGSNEESGMEDLPAYLSAEGEAPMTFTPDSHFPVTNVEKGQFRATVSRAYEHPGADNHVSMVSGDTINIVPGEAKAKAGDIEIAVKGLSAHASLPETGTNAGVIMIKLLSGLEIGGEEGEAIRALASLFPCGDHEGRAIGAASSDDVAGATTVSPDIWRIDESGVSVQIDARTSLKFDADKVKRAVEAAGLTLSVERFNEAHAVPADSPLVKTLLDAYEAVSGKEGYAEAIGGGTYVHGFKRGVAFGAVGAGTDTRMHGADEYMSIKELKEAALIYALSIAKLLT